MICMMQTRPIGARYAQGDAPQSTAGDLTEQVAERYLEVNGTHSMTAEDDGYVDAYFVTVEALAATVSHDAQEIRQLMLAGALPLPSYIRSDGAQMVPPDLFALATAAGGLENLPMWFASQFDDGETAAGEWEDYLSGGYVCLWHVSPATIKRKDELCNVIRGLLERPQPNSGEWLRALHAGVDALDALEPPFAPYDRLRFGGAVSRDRLITAVRRDFPRRMSNP